MRFGLGLGNGLGLRNQLAFGRGLPYTIKNKLLFLGNYSAIADGKMPNTLGSDWITVAGVSGSETYTCPNTVSYSNADVDNIWFNNPSSIRITTTAELIGYDFTRTFIKYLDSSPNSIEIIAIAKADSVFTQNELYIIQDYFRLSIWWSGALTGHGYLKSNRTLSRSLWINDLTLDVSTQAFLNRVYATGENQTGSRKLALNNVFTSLKTNGFFAKMDALWLTRGHGEKSTKLNLIKDAHNLEKGGAGTLYFTEDLGYRSDGTTYLRTNYIPSVHAVTVTQNSVTFCYKISGVLDTSAALHGNGGVSSSPTKGLSFISKSGTAYNRCNDGATTVGYPRIVGYNTMSRNLATSYSQYRDNLKSTFYTTSTGLPAVELYLLANNEAGVARYFEEVVTEISFIGGSFSETELATIIGIFNTYIANL